MSSYNLWMNDQYIYKALDGIGFAFLRYDKPYHLFTKENHHTIGYCLTCGIMLMVINGEKFRRRWVTRRLDELIAFANEGATRK